MISLEGRLVKWSQPWALSIILLLVGASAFCVIFVGSGVLAGAVTGSAKWTRDGCVQVLERSKAMMKICGSRFKVAVRW